MLYHLLYPLHETFAGFNVFRYITFRTAYAILTALIISFLIGPWLIRRLAVWGVGQQVREDGPQTHRGKQGTPTMGGIMILIAIFVPTILWADITNRYVWIVLCSTAVFGAIGFLDDYLKVVRRHPGGLSAWRKIGLQVAAALVVSLFLYFDPKDPYHSILSIPFFKRWLLDLSWFYIPFAVFVIVGASNAVNLTDGIDGLAIGLVGIAAAANAVLVYVSGHANFARYLQVLYLPGTGELAVFCGALMGAALGFLWFNAHPAQVFMGDVGSLSLGAGLGTLAVITKHEAILAVAGGIFVIEALSVIIQVGSFKLRGKRVFRMAPVHHHFELAGWAESKIIVRFWIVGIILALLSLSTLKLR
ncbi:MAG: phospho-N-acetylmuramoyl-pentapeptide-transferase [Nitrospirota bacterium]